MRDIAGAFAHQADQVVAFEGLQCGLFGIVEIERVGLGVKQSLATIRLPPPLRFRRGVANQEVGAVAHQELALDAVLQFAHVARPGLAGQPGQGVRMQFKLDHVVATGGFVDEMPGQHDDVVTALAQRRHGQFHDVEAVVQVGAEAILVDQGLEIVVAGGEDADIGREQAGAAERAVFAILQKAQQADLGFR